MSRIGVMVCGHGSRDVAAVREFQALAASLARRLPQYPVASGFLEFARPILREGLDVLRRQGVEHILAVPGMLFAAGHVKNDIPSVLNAYMAQHPGLRIGYGRDLAIDPRLLRASADRIAAAEAGSGRVVPREETLLLVVGRGTSDPDANANIAKVARMLWEGMGFGWAEACYSGVTFPLVAPGLEHAVRLGYRRIIVFPYFLFTGILVKRIYRVTDRMAERFPGIELLKAPYLNVDPLVLEVFAERIEEILAGQNQMNCQLCKYRAHVLGFEAEIGLPQAGHHHDVEGIGTGAGGEDGDGGGGHRPNGHDHTHHGHHHHHEHDGHSHDHGHAHPDDAARPPYPWRDHRHGPGRRDPDGLA